MLAEPTVARIPVCKRSNHDIRKFDAFSVSSCRGAAVFDAGSGRVVTQLADATETIGIGGERAQR
jgi:hypothetical protein